MPDSRTKQTFDVYTELSRDSLADAIVRKFITWENGRHKWERNYKATLEYVFATNSTEIGETQNNPWNNITHIPKLCQIYDLITTMYDEALFSSEDYIIWEGESLDEATNKKKRLMTAYAKSILAKGNFRDVVSKLLSDYVLSGNAFAIPVWDGVKAVAVRYNPLNVFFDPYSTDYKSAPKIFRKVVSMGELKKLSTIDEALAKAYKRVKENKDKVTAAITNGDTILDDLGLLAGVGEETSTFQNPETVEILTFCGDLYDITTDTYHEKTQITIADRCVLLEEKPLEDIRDGDYFFKAGWRDRLDMLWSMSPLENLLGMQYRIDFLENKRSDVYDEISNPKLVTKGDVTMPMALPPGAVINIPVDGDINYLAPEPSILAADTYIESYMSLMELMAGTPKEVAGWRTPGEKTAFEVDKLMTAGMRQFNRQIRKFEKEVFEPLINSLVELELSKKAGQTVQVKTTDPTTGEMYYELLSIDDMRMNGMLRAQGSTLYAERERVMQTLIQLGNSALFQNPAVLANFSPSMLGKIISTVAGLDKFENLYKLNAWIQETSQQQVDAEKANRAVDRTRAESLELAQAEGI